MEFNHKPVMLDECIEYLNIKPQGTYADLTLGGAGHSTEILKRLGTGGTLVGVDQDSFAIETARQRLNGIDSGARLILENGNFADVVAIFEKNGIKAADGILMDLGVSSHQLDEAERGFSYQKDAVLDMRMDKSKTLTAAAVVNEYGEDELRKVIRDYGEEKWASRIAEFIVRARRSRKIGTTFELVDIIKAAIPSSARREGPHPAKRTFQAIRIEVNNELGILGNAVSAAASLLGPAGRLCIITFHSLEDRIVKNEYQRMANPCICPPEFPVCTCGRKPAIRVITRKPVTASPGELDENPRSRSAKLRVAEKI